MHVTASQIKKFEKKSWNKYFKFAFVRNPYTHAISHWMFDEKNWSILEEKSKKKKKKFTKKNFVYYLKNLKKGIKKFYTHDMPFSNIYTINGKIAVDYIGKFEDLKNDINKIQKILKLPKSKFNLPHSKKNTKKNYLKYYSKESKKLVEEIWEKEFKLFNYTFPKTKN